MLGGQFRNYLGGQDRKDPAEDSRGRSMCSEGTDVAGILLHEDKNRFSQVGSLRTSNGLHIVRLPLLLLKD